MARLAMGGEARPTWPGQTAPFLMIRLLDGNDDWIKLEIEDLVQDRKMTIIMKRGEPASILADGTGYRVLFPEQDVAKEKEGTTHFATVLIFEEDEGSEFAKLLGALIAKNRSESVTDNQQAVEKLLLVVVAAEIEAMLEQQLLSHGGDPAAMRQMRSQFEEEMKENFHKQWLSVEAGFLPTEEEASLLLEKGPNRKENVAAIRANWEKLAQRNAALPFITVYLHQKFSKESEHDPWFLETLKRMLSVTIREMDEVSAP